MAEEKPIPEDTPEGTPTAIVTGNSAMTRTRFQQADTPPSGHIRKFLPLCPPHLKRNISEIGTDDRTALAILN
jgi:hypothetical protein